MGVKISYDPEVDAAYIRFVEGPIQVTTHRLSETLLSTMALMGRWSGLRFSPLRNILNSQTTPRKFNWRI